MRKYRIVEQQLTGKCGAEKCEDACLVTTNFVAVVDGSTSKSSLPPLPCGRTHGQIAAETVCRFLGQCAPDTDIETFCIGVTAELRREYHKYRPELSWQHLLEHPEDRFTCSAIIYSALRHEVWMIGDCHCLLIDDHGASGYYDNPKPMEAVLAAKRAERVGQLLAAGATVDDIRLDDQGRQAIIPQLKESMLEQNRAYAVIDGFHIPVDKTRVIDVSGCSALVLASDGYPMLFPTLSQSEDYLRNLLERDPLLIHDYQATKCWFPGNDSFDDRCFIRLDFTFCTKVSDTFV